MTTATAPLSKAVAIKAPVNDAFETILTPEALAFLSELHYRFNATRLRLLQEREAVQRRIDGGWKPHFLEKTQVIREADWKVAPIPADLQDRRVEITGPVDRKMVINALNSGAKVFMADFEDSHAPSWFNTIGGQINLRDAIEGSISYLNPENGKSYRLQEKVATLMVRPRGWHLPEKHITIDGEPASGSLVDFGLFFFTTPTPWCVKAAALISTCPNWRAMLKHVSGTRSSPLRSSI